MGDFAKGLERFHTKGYFGKPVRMNLTIGIRLLDLVDIMKDHTPEENDQEYMEAMRWIEYQVCKRYSQADRAAWRAGQKKR